MVGNADTLVTLGDLAQPGPIFAALGFAVIVALAYRQITGAVMVGILLVTSVSIGLGFPAWMVLSACRPV